MLGIRDGTGRHNSGLEQPRRTNIVSSGPLIPISFFSLTLQASFIFLHAVFLGYKLVSNPNPGTSQIPQETNTRVLKTAPPHPPHEWDPGPHKTVT